MLITNGTIVTPGVRRRTIRRQVNLGPMSLRIVTIVIIAAAAIITLAQATKSATAAYTRGALEKEHADLDDEVNRYRDEEIRLRALKQFIPQESTEMATPKPEETLVPSDKINFLPGSSMQNISQLPSTTSSLR